MFNLQLFLLLIISNLNDNILAILYPVTTGTTLRDVLLRESIKKAHFKQLFRLY